MKPPGGWGELSRPSSGDDVTHPPPPASSGRELAGAGSPLPPSPAPDSLIPAPPRLGVSTEEGWGQKAQGPGGGETAQVPVLKAGDKGDGDSKITAERYSEGLSEASRIRVGEFPHFQL